jgi:uncharacterized membrane protein (TIGR02234 family)
MTVRREYAVTLAVLAAGAILALVTAGRTWATVTVEGALRPETILVTGTDLTGAARALGLLGLSGVLAVVATRRWVRRIIGAGIAAAGIAASVAVGRVAADLRSSALDWAQSSADGVATAGVTDTVAPWLALIGCLLVALAGVAVLLRGHRWPVLGASYERRRALDPAVERAEGGRTAWDALDRGEDPTL